MPSISTTLASVNGLVLGAGSAEGNLLFSRRKRGIATGRYLVFVVPWGVLGTSPMCAAAAKCSCFADQNGASRRAWATPEQPCRGETIRPGIAVGIADAPPPARLLLVDAEIREWAGSVRVHWFPMVCRHLWTNPFDRTVFPSPASARALGGVGHAGCSVARRLVGFRRLVD